LPTGPKRLLGAIVTDQALCRITDHRCSSAGSLTKFAAIRLAHSGSLLGGEMIPVGIRKFFDELASNGVISAARRTGNSLRKKIGVSPEKIQIEVSKNINDLLGGMVTYGPFKGLRLGPIRDQERTHRASLLLGLFEKEILDALNSIPSNYNTFINLGAGQGYYGIGVLANNSFEISIVMRFWKNIANILSTMHV
jgi:hypothetical protein